MRRYLNYFRSLVENNIDIVTNIIESKSITSMLPDELYYVCLYRLGRLLISNELDDIDDIQSYIHNDITKFIDENVDNFAINDCWIGTNEYDIEYMKEVGADIDLFISEGGYFDVNRCLKGNYDHYR